MNKHILITYDIFCIICVLFLIFPTIIPQVKQTIDKQLIILVNIILFCLGIASITYEQVHMRHSVVEKLKHQKYLYWGTSLLVGSSLNLIFINNLI